MSAASAILRQPVLRMLAGMLLLQGAHNAAIYPYLSRIAIHDIGMSEPALALLMTLASGLAVGASVLIGVLGDQRANRRQLAIFTALAALAGNALMLFWPGKLSLVLAHGVLFPLAWGMYGQAFALAGLVLAGTPGQRDGVQAVIRACMSVSFLALLIGFTFLFADRFDARHVYQAGGLASLGIAALTLAFWPRDGAGDWHAAPSGLNLLQSFAEIARLRILLRMGFLGLILSAPSLYMVLASLIFEATPGRSAGDVALYVGMVAGWEVPFMLALSRLAGRLRRATQIALGAGIYCGHLVLLPLLAGHWAVWLLPLLAGFGGAAILTLPIGYYQDLLRGRTGAAAALMALQKLVSDAAAAAVFAIGTAVGGYQTTALIGGAVMLAGALALYLADRGESLVAGAGHLPELR
jgi:predicted MFS family arabinose efflux permease